MTTVQSFLKDIIITQKENTTSKIITSNKNTIQKRSQPSTDTKQLVKTKKVKLDMTSKEKLDDITNNLKKMKTSRQIYL